jgi:Uma2 family endonuclease
MGRVTRATSHPRATVEDWLAIPEGTRAELIGGEILMTPPPSVRHARACGAIHSALRAWARGSGFGEAFTAVVGVLLPTGDAVEPDVVFVARAQAAIVADDVIRGAPALLVEVVSPTHPERDLVVKRALYERNGVREYWIVRPDDRTVEVLRLEGPAWGRPALLAAGATLSSPLLPGFALPVDEVFAG